jgi:hypothetical protein
MWFCNDFFFPFVYPNCECTNDLLGMFTSYLGIGQNWKVDHKVCFNLCDLKVGWRAHRVIRELELHVIVISLSVSFSIVLVTNIASSFDVQSIEKLNGNHFHTWKMKIEFSYMRKICGKSFQKNYRHQRLNLKKCFLKKTFMSSFFSWRK